MSKFTSFALVLLMASGLLQAQATPNFLVHHTKGDSFLGPDLRSLSPAVANSQHPLGSWAKTAAGASIEIGFDADNRFRLLPNSQLQIQGTGSANERFRRVLHLGAGQVDLQLDKMPKGAKVEVETPTAICGAVGTRFQVDAKTGEMVCSQGLISAQSKFDSSLSAEAVQGRLQLAPGTENAFSKAEVNGRLRVNGVPVSGTVGITVAKARGDSRDAAILLTQGTLLQNKAGSYLMREGKLELVDQQSSGLHRDYLEAASKEGSLHLQRESLRATQQNIPTALENDLRAAAKRATELRKQLFERRTVRETVSDVAREAARVRP